MLPSANLHGLKFHHIGLAVRREEPALRLAKLLGYTVGEQVYDEIQNVCLRMCDHPTEPGLEIISAGPTPGPVDVMVQRHTSGIVYHTCYETENLAATLDALTGAGMKSVCIAPPRPALLFHHRRVCFYNVLGLGLVEFLEPAE